MQVGGRLEYLDSLRAIAALLVVWLHVSEEFVRLPGVEAQGVLLHEMASTLDFGRVGVVAFFAISGFIIPRSINGDRAVGSRKFLVSRFFRLFPAYWLSIPLALAVLWWMPGKSISGWSVAGNFTMLESFLGYQPIMGHYWTLEVELIFYATCLLLFQFNLVHRPAVNATLSMALCLIFIAVTSGLLWRWFRLTLDLQPKFAFMAYNLGIMFWGSICQHCLLARPGKLDLLLLACCTTLVCFPPVWALAHITEENQAGAIRFAAGYGLGVLLFVSGVTVLKIRWRVLAWIGSLSYSLYLFHPIIFYSVLFAIQHYQWSFLEGLHLGVYLVVCTLLSILLAWLVYTFIEQPSSALGRRITRR